MLEKKKTHKNTGFTLLELVVAVTVLAVLTSAAAPAIIKHVEKAKEVKYMKEAESVYTAFQLYLFDKDEEGKVPRITEVFEDLIKPMDEKNHILHPYLTGKITKGGKIYDLSYSGTVDSLEEIGYRVDGYEIRVEANGRVTVLERPGKHNTSVMTK